jgi:hypothetical protein
MKQTSPRIAVLLLMVALVSSPAFAGGGRDIRLDQPQVFASLWHFLETLWSAPEKARGSMDPNGSPEGDARGSMDPDGQPASSSPADEGDARGTMDPDGKP